MAEAVGFIYYLADSRRPWTPWYYGKTVKRLKARLSQHVCSARRGTRTHVAAWIRKLLRAGEIPVIRPIEQCWTRDHLTTAERAWIAKGRARGECLCNLTDGGDGTSGYVHTPEARAKLAATQRGKKHTPEVRARMSAAQRGKKHTSETRVKLAGLQRGKKLTPEVRARMSAAQRGKKLTPEHRAKISAARRGKKLTPEHRAKISASQRGKKLTPEHRAKIGAANRAAWVRSRCRHV